MKKIIQAWGFLALNLLLLGSCAEDSGSERTSPSVVLASGCQLDAPIEIGTDNLIQGRENILLLKDLKFDRLPLALAPSALSDLELHLFEQWTQIPNGTPYGTGFAAYRLTQPLTGFHRGSRPVSGGFGKFQHEKSSSDDRKKYTSSEGEENTPAWKLEAALTGSRLTALELTYKISQPSGAYAGETLCVKSAKVMQFFAVP